MENAEGGRRIQSVAAAGGRARLALRIRSRCVGYAAVVQVDMDIGDVGDVGDVMRCGYFGFGR